MIQEGDFRSHNLGGCAGFLDTLLWSSVRPGFPFGKHGDPDLVPLLDFLDQNGSAAELDVVGMGPYRQDLHRVPLPRPRLR